MNKMLSEVAVTSVYFPGYTSSAPYLTELSQNKVSIDQVVSELASAFDFSPPSDDQPFFYKFESGLPRTVSGLLIGITFLCLLTLGFVYRFAGRQKLFQTRRGHRGNHLGLFAVFFSALGMGFMLLELSLMQKFTLFLGHPTNAISVTLFSFLVSSGVGGLFSKRLIESNSRRLTQISILIVTIILLDVFFLPIVLNALLGLTMIVRSILTLVLLFPLGLLLGVLFPFGMNMLRTRNRESIPWIWCVNGVFSMLGSNIAIALAMSSGFTSSLLLATLMYGLTLIIGQKLTQSNIWKSLDRFSEDSYLSSSSHHVRV